MKPVIEHQMQPCPVSCMATSLAMICGKPAAEIIQSLHERYRQGNTSLRSMLEELHVPFRSFDSCDNNCLEFIGAYLVGVPSLNIQGGTHEIVIEVTEDDYFVFDPVKGRDGKLFYEKRGYSDADLAVELGGFNIDAFIDRRWLEARK